MSLQSNKIIMPAKFFKGNRDRLRKAVDESAPIVLTANGLMQRSTDSPYEFSQDGNFWYLTGVEVPNVMLVMDKGREYLIIPELSAARVAFDGAIDTAELSKTSGIQEVLLERQGLARLKSRLKRAKNVAVLPPAPAYVEALGMYTNPARRRTVESIKNINPEATLLDLRQQLARMRMVKQPVEIEAIAQAVDITVKSMSAIKRNFLAGRYENEYDIEHELSGRFIKSGADGHGFTPIVAAGAKASTVHPSNNNLPIKKGDPLLIDAGAKCGQYSGDLTRTWAKTPSKRLQAVHQSVAETADYALSLLKPGLNLRAYEKQIEKFMGEKLHELKLIKTTSPKSIRKYYPHTTSHFLGIDVHDAGDYDQPLEEGVVITVEPGIYIPEEGIGLRLEDDVVITPNGAKILSARLPRTLS